MIHILSLVKYFSVNFLKLSIPSLLIFKAELKTTNKLELYIANAQVTSWVRQDLDKQTGMVDDFEDFFKGKSECP